MLTQEAKLKINSWFRFYPLTDDKAERCEEIWDKAGKALAEAILDEENQCIDEEICELEQAIYRNCPDGLERDYALQNLDEVREGFFSTLESGGTNATVCVLRFGVLLPAITSINQTD